MSPPYVTRVTGCRTSLLSFVMLGTLLPRCTLIKEEYCPRSPNTRTVRGLYSRGHPGRFSSISLHFKVFKRFLKFGRTADSAGPRVLTGWLGGAAIGFKGACSRQLGLIQPDSLSGRALLSPRLAGIPYSSSS